jgi:hypothetical protein
MSLVSKISDLATAIGTAVKSLNTRATALEARTEVVMLSESDYAALDPKDPDVFYAVFPDPP